METERKSLKNGALKGFSVAGLFTLVWLILLITVGSQDYPAQFGGVTNNSAYYIFLYIPAFILVVGLFIWYYTSRNFRAGGFLLGAGLGFFVSAGLAIMTLVIMYLSTVRYL
jgi:hypothetical protein